jgi:hypothetical protein
MADMWLTTLFIMAERRESGWGQSIGGGVSCPPHRHKSKKDILALLGSVAVYVRQDV